jgi:hypothetical protein
MWMVSAKVNLRNRIWLNYPTFKTEQTAVVLQLPRYFQEQLGCVILCLSLMLFIFVTQLRIVTVEYLIAILAKVTEAQMMHLQM